MKHLYESRTKVLTFALALCITCALALNPHMANGATNAPLAPTQPGVNIRRVSFGMNGVEIQNSSIEGQVSSDGKQIAFLSTENLVDGDQNRTYDVYLKDLTTNDLRLVSIISDATTNSQTPVSFGGFSDDWRIFAFASSRSYLDENNYEKVYVRNLISDTTNLVSKPNYKDSNGITPYSNGTNSKISGDGNYVYFNSAEPMVPNGPRNSAYYHDLRSAKTYIVPHCDYMPNCYVSSISADGLKSLVYSSGALFASNIAEGTFTRVFSGIEPSLAEVAGNRDLSVIAISTSDTRLTLGTVANTQIAIFKLNNDGYYTLDSVVKNSSGELGNSESRNPKISGDGKFVVFQSYASNLVDNDVGYYQDVYIYDTQTHKVKMLSVSQNGVQGNYDSVNPFINTSGTAVTFATKSTTFDLSDSNNSSDIYMVDLGQPQTPTPTPSPSPTIAPVNTKPYVVMNFFGHQGFYGPQMQCQGTSQYSASDPTLAGYPDITGMPAWIASSGYDVWLGTYKTGPYETGGVAANVTGRGCVADQIARVRSKLQPGQKIWIVCHSMGCAESMWYLNHTPNVSDFVAGIALDGAPVKGIPWNTPSICNSIASMLKPVTLASGSPCDLNKQIAFAEVLEQNVSNLGFTCAPGVEYDVIGGSSLSPFAMISKVAFAGAQAPLYYTDGLIATSSSLGLTCAKHKFLTSEAHISNCAVAPNGYMNSCLAPAQREAYHIIMDLLSGNFSATTIAAEARAAVANVLLPYVPSNQGYNGFTVDGSGGSSWKIAKAAGVATLSAEASDGSALFVVEGTSADRTLALLRPDGTQVDLGNPTGEVSVTQSTAATMVVVTGGMHGVWQLQISPNVSLAYQLQASAYFSPSAQLQAGAPATVTTGSSATITATLTGGVVKNATHRIQITAPDGSGSFSTGSSASFALSVQGKYMVEVAVSYTDGNGNVAQQKKLLTITANPAVVVPPVATVTVTPLPTSTPVATATPLPTSTGTVVATVKATLTPMPTVAQATVTPALTATATQVTATQTPVPTSTAVSVTTTPGVTVTPQPLKKLVFLPMLSR